MPSQKYEDLIFLSNLMENVHSYTIQKMLYYTNPTQKKNLILFHDRGDLWQNFWYFESGFLLEVSEAIEMMLRDGMGYLGLRREWDDVFSGEYFSKTCTASGLFVRTTSFFDFSFASSSFCRSLSFSCLIQTRLIWMFFFNYQLKLKSLVNTNG